MSLSPVPLAGGAVLVEGHVVLALRVGVLVQRGRVRVVPVLLKLLAEHALPAQLLLPWGNTETLVSKRCKRKHCTIPYFVFLVFSQLPYPGYPEDEGCAAGDDSPG